MPRQARRSVRVTIFGLLVSIFGRACPLDATDPPGIRPAQVRERQRGVVAVAGGDPARAAGAPLRCRFLSGSEDPQSAERLRRWRREARQPESPRARESPRTSRMGAPVEGSGSRSRGRLSPSRPVRPRPTPVAPETTGQTRRSRDCADGFGDEAALVRVTRQRPHLDPPRSTVRARAPRNQTSRPGTYRPSPRVSCVSCESSGPDHIP